MYMLEKMTTFRIFPLLFFCIMASLSAFHSANAKVQEETTKFIGPEVLRDGHSKDENTDTILSYLYKRRVALVGVMVELEKQLDTQLAINVSSDAVRFLTSFLDNDLLVRIDEIALAIFENVKGDLSAELSFHKQLRINTTRFHFKAGTRQCMSHEEAFYEATQRCERLDTYNYGPFIGKETIFKNESGVCVSNERQQFVEVDPRRNIGRCECKQMDTYGRELFYFPKDDACYVEGEKGFCGEDEWTVKEESLLRCRKKPTDCPADGFHAFGIVRGFIKQPGCFQVGSQGPCGDRMHLMRGRESGVLLCVGELF